ncbi:hypothetical protein TTRE_0000024101 [Trichuris trichiura]|uniref:Uncharacterized protein n=1 Tax=Trichuris trichiura TaxID=36087 RepID=A0A077YV43_TRITR|nr:hypothetical protein TTRE_0000024101 [Trichuris trichiura]
MTAVLKRGFFWPSPHRLIAFKKKITPLGPGHII